MGEATITRTFDAPRERVWQAFTEPADVADDPQHETLAYTLVDLGNDPTEATYHRQGHGFSDRLEAHLAT